MTPVAVKILKSDASRETRSDFRREVKIMSSFDHENILKLIGVVPTSKHLKCEDNKYSLGYCEITKRKKFVELI